MAHLSLDGEPLIRRSYARLVPVVCYVRAAISRIAAALTLRCNSYNEEHVSVSSTSKDFQTFYEGEICIVSKIEC